MRIALNGAIPPKSLGVLRRDGNGWKVEYEGGEILALQDRQEFHALGRDSYRLLGMEDGTAMVVRFADLHRHSDNSLQDAISKVSDIVEATEYSGALTDHGNMYGFLEYYEKMLKANKKPILGFEGYMPDMEGKLTGRHVILLAKNNIGYKHLLKLTSESFDHFNWFPHVTWDMLEKYHEGVICLSACLGGVIPSALAERDFKTARAAVERFIGIFGKEDFYIEIQKHGIKDEDCVRPLLVELAKEYGLKYVATTDSHYPTPEDRTAHQAVLCLRTNSTLSDPKLKYGGDGYFLHTSEDMEERFVEYPEALDNTLELADKCDVSIRLGDVNLPDYQFPAPFKNANEYMKYLAEEGYKARFEGTPQMDDPEYRKRFSYELEMIERMGFCAYFVIVWDFINYARTNNIYVGPGRGSAAGSMVAYCMGITDLDPIKYGLLFERFLNPERISYPDIDTDIEYSGRPKVIRYMTEKYGESRVCRIVTFGTFAAKQALKDVARVMGLPASYGAKLSSMIMDPKMTLPDAMKKVPELIALSERDPVTKQVVDLATRIEGCKRHASQHACGLCVAPSDVSDFLPTAMVEDEETKTKALTAQVTMEEVEKLSLIKMDLLGLRTLGVIHECIDVIQKRYGTETVLRQIGSSRGEVRYQDIPLNDRATYETLRAGMTGGVFQLESPQLTSIVSDMLYDIDKMDETQLEDTGFERLVAAVALYRPGPMDFIPDYLAGLRDPAAVHYDCPQEEECLKVTYGVMVYQEQLIQIARMLAGYTMGEADILRKACGKKKKDMLAKQHDHFVFGNKKEFDAGKANHYILGCAGNGIDIRTAEEIWGKVDKFGSYAFNRSHSVCYAYISYLTAYLSTHYKKEFYAALINAFLDKTDKTKVYMAQASRRNIRLIPPDVQQSMSEFSATDDGILFGLQGISGLKKQAEIIVAERTARGAFGGLQDLYERLANRDVKLNKKSIEGLVYSGALRAFSSNKNALLRQFEDVKSNYEATATNRALGQFSLFSTEESKVLLPSNVEPMPEQLEMEKERDALGMYVSRHPVDFYAKAAAIRPDYTPLDTLINMRPGFTKLKTMGLVRGLRVFPTRNGDTMASFSLETKFSSIDCVVFPEPYQTVSLTLRDDEVFCVSGCLGQDNKEEDKLQLRVEEVAKAKTELRDVLWAVVVEVSCLEEQNQVLSFLKANPGKTPVILKSHGCYFPIKSKVNGTPENKAYLKSICKNPYVPNKHDFPELFQA